MEDEYFIKLIRLRNVNQENPSPTTSSSQQVHLCLCYQVNRLKVFRSRSGVVACTGVEHGPIESQRFWMDIDYLKDHRLITIELSRRFADREIDDVSLYASLAYELVQGVFEAEAASDSKQVSPLIFSVTRERKELCDEMVISGEEISVNLDNVMGVRESRLGYHEERNYNHHEMVPTEAEALIMKCVRVKDEIGEEKGGCEDCSICLNGLQEFAAAMPCKHMFHGSCIIKWLRQSHYCPLCRFQMPTQHDPIT